MRDACLPNVLDFFIDEECQYHDQGSAGHENGRSHDQESGAHIVQRNAQVGGVHIWEQVQQR